jgi:hypothetical protein
LKQVGVRHSGIKERGQAPTTWLKGYHVAFDLAVHGVPVWGDGIDVTIVGDEIQRCASRHHVLPTNAPPLTNTAKVLPPLQALRGALRDIKRELNLHGQYDIVDAGLFFVPETVLGRPRSPGDPVYVAAWRFVINPNPADQSRRAGSDLRLVWAGASDGAFWGKGIY